jgi:hypothetical protein
MRDILDVPGFVSVIDRDAIERSGARHVCCEERRGSSS